MVTNPVERYIGKAQGGRIQMGCCAAHIFVSYLSISGQIFSLLLIAIERAISVHYPLKSRLWLTAAKTKKVIKYISYPLEYDQYVILLVQHLSNPHQMAAVLESSHRMKVI